MERKRSAAADRLLTLLSSPSPSSQPSSSFELEESDLFDPAPVSNPELVAVPFSRRSSFPRPPEGMLAALPVGAAASVASSPSSTSSSPSSSSRMIPQIPKPRRDSSPQSHQYQSAPVNVPIIPSRFKSRQDSILESNSSRFLESKSEEEQEEDEQDPTGLILPPHEILERRESRARESPLTTFSVLEGKGRTLKGRDLRQVRNAVWRTTGFMD